MNEHIRTVICSVCGAYYDELGSCRNFADGKCIVCNGKCDHAYTWGESTFVNEICSLCGFTCTHSWSNGVCTICNMNFADTGLTCTSHEWGDYSYTNQPITCNVCAITCNHATNERIYYQGSDGTHSYDIFCTDLCKKPIGDSNGMHECTKILDPNTNTYICQYCKQPLP